MLSHYLWIFWLSLRRTEIPNNNQACLQKLEVAGANAKWCKGSIQQPHISMFVYLSSCLPICLYVCLFVCVSVYLSMCLSICLCVCLFVRVSVSLSGVFCFRVTLCKLFTTDTSGNAILGGSGLGGSGRGVTVCNSCYCQS